MGSRVHKSCPIHRSRAYPLGHTQSPMTSASHFGSDAEFWSCNSGAVNISRDESKEVDQLVRGVEFVYRRSVAEESFLRLRWCWLTTEVSLLKCTTVSRSGMYCSNFPLTSYPSSRGLVSGLHAWLLRSSNVFLLASYCAFLRAYWTVEITILTTVFTSNDSK